MNYIRSLQGKNSAPVPSENVESGKEIFYGKGGCAQCHMVRGTGGFIGPELSEYGASHSADDIRNAILNESKRPGIYKSLAKVTTSDGKQIVGLMRNDDNFSVQIQALDGTFYMLERSCISKLTFAPVPLMPRGYDSVLSKAEFDKLVSYLLSLRDTKQ